MKRTGTTATVARIPSCDFCKAPAVSCSPDRRRPMPDKTWTTEQLRAEFDVLGFSMGFVVLKRKADGQVGSMQFDHAPRVYYGWTEDRA